ncbi:MAG TPA: amidohydrolase family protein [Methylomirabilota bacterium]|nr:amidohydrolase family protein [Methylomirabilota bacterium]
MNSTALTRRNFIAANLSAALALTGCATFSDRSPGIIDTHTHFYDPTRPGGVDWPGKDDKVLYRPVLPEEYVRLAKPLGITGTVVVEASPRVEDNQWILDLARREPFLRGLVGHLKPGQPGFAADLERFAANPLFRGMRTGGWAIPITPDSTPFVRDLALLAERGLALDVLCGPDQLPNVAALAAVLPKLKIVIDHCGGPRIDGKTPDQKWSRAIDNVARHPNVFMKVSGLVEATGKENTAPSDVEFYKPILDQLWRSFGEDRVIFGSNWPVSNRFAQLPTVVEIVKQYFVTHGPEASAKYFTHNARRVYRYV